MSSEIHVQIFSMLATLSFPVGDDDIEKIRKKEKLFDIFKMVISGDYGEAHAALQTDAPFLSSAQKKEIRKVASDAILFEREREWSSHGIWRSFRFWSLTEKKAYLEKCSNLISYLRNLTPYVVFGFGSILGFVREKDFIAHDDDMDLLLAFPMGLVRDFTDAKKLVKDYLSAGGFEPYNEGLTHMTVNGADVFIGFIDADSSVSWFPSKRGGLEFNDVFPSITREIFGIECELPANPEKYLEVTYGLNWRDPDSGFMHPWDQTQYQDLGIGAVRPLRIDTHTEKKIMTEKAPPFPPESMSTAKHLKNFQRDYLTIECGEWTYGNPRLEVAPADHPRKISIGRYCSIASNVTIYVGRQGRHPTDTLSTYPLSLPVSAEALKNGAAKLQGFSKTQALGSNSLDVFIGHDVWVGQNAVIFAGVKIGNGAVIGANALVTKDVPDYAIVGGVPARVIRYRHSPDLVSRISASRWWDLQPDDLWRLIGENAWSTDMASVLDLIEAGSRDSGMDARFKFWPAEDLQKTYTGASGELLYTRTRKFVDFLTNDGALDGDDPAVLDYACGWGRIASVLYDVHQVQCVLADAWEKTQAVLKSTGLPGEIVKVPTLLDDSSFGGRRFSLIYAFSIFTHLNFESFVQNLGVLIKSLRPEGRLYLTVRHENFLETFNKKSNTGRVEAVDPCGFYHYTYSDGVYGETIIGSQWFESLGIKATYCCEIDPMQHLYRISR